MIDILKFDSRKRMSVVVQHLDNADEVIVYTKGADTQIYDKSKPYHLFAKIN